MMGAGARFKACPKCKTRMAKATMIKGHVRVIEWACQKCGYKETEQEEVVGGLINF